MQEINHFSINFVTNNWLITHLQRSTSRRLITGSVDWANWSRGTREILSGFRRRSFWSELLTWPRRCMRCLEEALEAEQTRTQTTPVSWRRYSTSTRAAATRPRWTSTAGPRTLLRGRTAILRSPPSQHPDISPAWLAFPSLAAPAYSTQLRQVSCPLISLISASMLLLHL